MIHPDQVINKKLLDSLAEDLLSTTDYIHMPGMRVWQIEYGWTRLGDIKSVQWPPRAECTIPDLCDFPTIGCLMQQAWRIVEREKEKAISRKKKFPPYMITSDMVMGNLDIPPAVSHWCEALRHFALNGLTDINGLSHLVDVFKCASAKQDSL